MNGVVLTGIDGLNPLGFLAAIGTLRVLDDHARRTAQPTPRLAWRDDGEWRPVVHGPKSLDAVVAIVVEDLPTWRDEPALGLAYASDGNLVPPDSRSATRDLKPPPKAMRTFLQQVADRAAMGSIRSARHAAAYGSDVVQDNNGNTKPTALHFTAGQQTFLGAVACVFDKLRASPEFATAAVREALQGPWTRNSTLKTLGWDTMGAFNARMYALRAGDPSADKRPCVPGAEWLAFIGLCFLPSAPMGNRLVTACVDGGWKDAQMTWPLWTAPTSARGVESLLRIPPARLKQMTARQRAALGIGAVAFARIVRAAQGGYGAFAPTSLM